MALHTHSKKVASKIRQITKEEKAKAPGKRLSKKAIAGKSFGMVGKRI